MDLHLKAALDDPERKRHLARALEYAELEMRKYNWRGQQSPVSTSKSMIADTRTAEDFVAEALKRLVNGKRKYQPKVDLYLNLKSIIRSIINIHKKSSDRNPLLDRRQAGAGEEEEFDPTLLISDLDSPTAHELLDGKERRAAAKGWYETLIESLQDKPELLAVANSIYNDFTEGADIAIVCDCSVARVYQLKRALKKHAITLFGAQTTAELERRTMGT